MKWTFATNPQVKLPLLRIALVEDDPVLRELNLLYRRFATHRPKRAWPAGNREL
jgi:hypothetical protein